MQFFSVQKICKKFGNKADPNLESDFQRADSQSAEIATKSDIQITWFYQNETLVEV